MKKQSFATFRNAMMNCENDFNTMKEKHIRIETLKNNPDKYYLNMTISKYGIEYGMKTNRLTKNDKKNTPYYNTLDMNIGRYNIYKSCDDNCTSLFVETMNRISPLFVGAFLKNRFAHNPTMKTYELIVENQRIAREHYFNINDFQIDLSNDNNIVSYVDNVNVVRDENDNITEIEFNNADEILENARNRKEHKEKEHFFKYVDRPHTVAEKEKINSLISQLTTIENIIRYDAYSCEFRLRYDILKDKKARFEKDKKRTIIEIQNSIIGNSEQKTVDFLNDKLFNIQNEIDKLNSEIEKIEFSKTFTKSEIESLISVRQKTIEQLQKLTKQKKMKIETIPYTTIEKTKYGIETEKNSFIPDNYDVYDLHQIAKEGMIILFNNGLIRYKQEIFLYWNFINSMLRDYTNSFVSNKHGKYTTTSMIQVNDEGEEYNIIDEKELSCSIEDLLNYDNMETMVKYIEKNIKKIHKKCDVGLCVNVFKLNYGTEFTFREIAEKLNIDLRQVTRFARYAEDVFRTKEGYNLITEMIYG